MSIPIWLLSVMAVFSVIGIFTTVVMGLLLFEEWYDYYLQSNPERYKKWLEKRFKESNEKIRE